MKNPVLGAIMVIVLAGCAASGTTVVLNESKITEAKRIALDAPVAPWVAQIEIRLRQAGFTVKRISRDQFAAFNEEWANYVLVLDGSYYSGWQNRCFGGGYRFEFLTAELINLETNESVVSVSGEGYSESCPPASGTIYSDIVQAVSERWE
ncbi:MAG: hypothetical protein AB7E55_31515 [Pigmentiphaga sp.]